VDTLRKAVWLATGQGAASYDLDNVQSGVTYSALGCPAEIAVLNELTAEAFYLCTNTSGYSHLFKINISDRTAIVTGDVLVASLAIRVRKDEPEQFRAIS